MAEKYEDKTAVTRGAAGDGAEVYRDPAKKGLPVWLWPLLALLLLGLLFALFRPHHGTDEAPQSAPAATSTPVPPAPAAATTTTPAPAPADASATPAAAPIPGQDIKIKKGTDIATAQPDQASAKGEPLSDVVTFAASADPTTLIGRKAKFQDVQIQKVISDRAFFVGPTATQQILVLLDQGMKTGPDAPKTEPLKAGQMTSLTGIVEALPTQETVNQTYGLSAADYAGIQSQKAYLHATVLQKK